MGIVLQLCGRVLSRYQHVILYMDIWLATRNCNEGGQDVRQLSLLQHSGSWTEILSVLERRKKIFLGPDCRQRGSFISGNSRIAISYPLFLWITMCINP